MPWGSEQPRATGGRRCGKMAWTRRLADLHDQNHSRMMVEHRDARFRRRTGLDGIVAGEGRECPRQGAFWNGGDNLSELTPVRSDLFEGNRSPSIGPPRSRIKARETDKIAPTRQGRCGRPPVARHGARLDRREQATSRLAGCGFALLEWRKLFLALLHFTLRERGYLGGHLLHVDMLIRYFFEGCGWV